MQKQEGNEVESFSALMSLFTPELWRRQCALPPASISVMPWSVVPTPGTSVELDPADMVAEGR